MTARELLHAEIETLDDQSVDAVYQLVRQYANSQPGVRSGDLLTLLRNVKIDGPADFSANLDLYLTGEKSVSGDVC